MRPINLYTCTRCFAIGWAFFACFSAYASTASDSKIECVGRYQISLPSDVEVATTIPNALIKVDTVDKQQFADGSIASRSTIHYQGSLEVTPLQTSAEFTKLRRDTLSRKEKAKKYFLEQDEFEIADSIKELKQELPETFIWQSNNTVDAFLLREKRVFHYFVSGLERPGEHAKVLNKFISSFRPRLLFTTPKESGVCIPYGFIADDGKPARHVAVTMRLKDHPEVEIFFEDQSARDDGIKQTVQTQERTELSLLWNGMAQSAKRIDLLFPDYHSITLDGRIGTASFAEITQTDGSKDYGYAAVVNGDHTSKIDAPQLKFYVIRKASRAKGKPISKSELKEMAHKIAASIKRRNVN